MVIYQEDIKVRSLPDPSMSPDPSASWRLSTSLISESSKVLVLFTFPLPYSSSAFEASMNFEPSKELDSEISIKNGSQFSHRNYKNSSSKNFCAYFHTGTI